TYCYLPARTDRRRMSAAVLDATFRGVLQSRFVRNELTVVWHAGEPLALPPDWYEAAFARAERHRPHALRLRHSFQSNGLLLDARWIEFLRRSGAEIGLSIDGPAHLHDRTRLTRSGAGTHWRAMRGLDPYGQETEPLRILSVGVAGDVGSFSPEFLGMRDARYGDFTFGNVLTDDIETITSRILASSLARDIRAGIAACERSCAWFR